MMPPRKARPRAPKRVTSVEELEPEAAALPEAAAGGSPGGDGDG